MMNESQPPPRPVNQPGARKEEEMVEDEAKEPGRQEPGAGTPTARDSTSINPQDPIDPASPKMPPA